MESDGCSMSWLHVGLVARLSHALSLFPFMSVYKVGALLPKCIWTADYQVGYLLMGIRSKNEAINNDVLCKCMHAYLTLNSLDDN